MLVKRLKNKLQSVKMRIEFRYFRSQVNSNTWSEHERHINGCIALAKQHLNQALNNDPIYLKSEQLRLKAMSSFKNRYKENDGLRVMLHVPSTRASPGGASIFRSWLDGLRFLGVRAIELHWDSDTSNAIREFHPSVLFTSDHKTYTEQFDWDFIRRYRAHSPMAVILTSSHEHDGNSSNLVRLKQARNRGVSLFVSFRDDEYIQNWLQEWWENGFKVISIPFSANPLIYSYVPTSEKPLDYVFLASSNLTEKFERYKQYLLPIFRRYRGVINGLGWGQDELILAREYHRFIYSMAKIGINLHIPTSIRLVSEINERTYILACCGLFQLTDKPKTLNQVFGTNAIVSADNPRKYVEKFEYFINHPEERLPFILRSLESVYDSHTIFHRMDKFVKKLLTLEELRPVL